MLLIGFLIPVIYYTSKNDRLDSFTLELEFVFFEIFWRKEYDSFDNIETVLMKKSLCKNVIYFLNRNFCCLIEIAKNK